MTMRAFRTVASALLIFAISLSAMGQRLELVFPASTAETPEDTIDNAEVMGREGIRSALRTLLIPYISELQRLSEQATGDVVEGSATLQRMYDALDLVMEADELIADAEELAEDGDMQEAAEARKEAKLKYRDAIPKLEDVFKEDPTLVAVWATLGWTYWLVDRRQDTIDLWVSVQRLNPDDPKPYAFLGTAYFATKRLRAAESNFLKSLERDPDQPDVRMRLGVLYRWLGRFQKSVDVLKALLADDPDRLDVQNELALSLYHNRDFVEALKLLPTARKSEPDPDKSVQYALAEIRSLLFSGNPDGAIELLEQFLAEDPESVELLLLRADAPCYKNRPEEAIPFLSRILEVTDDPDIQREVIRRLVEITTRLWADDPAEYPLNNPIRLVRKVLKSDPELVEWRLLLGELLLMDHRYIEAGRSFKKVLSKFNPHNLRARIGLLEVNQATGNTREAEKYLDLISSFNEADPYQHDRTARFELSRNSPQRSYEAIDRLEKEGMRGAAAILMYRSLSRSDWSGRISMRQFHEHLAHLKAEGFVFLSAEQLPDYFAQRGEYAGDDMSDYTPEKVAVICFDSPREGTMELATEVASNMDVPLSTFIPVGPTEGGLSSATDWQALRKYRKSGAWSFGSFLMDSHALVPVDDAGHTGGALANRALLESGSLETEEEFLARLRREYEESKRIASLRLGDDVNVAFLLYPQGDIGQAANSNYGQAVAANQAEARSYYRCAFINMIHGYAVKGDNPLLFQYYSPGLFDSGKDISRRLHEHQPVLLARRLRAEVASLDGRIYRAKEMLEILERDGYPEPLLDKLRVFVKQHLAQNFEATAEIEHSKKRRYSLSLEQPYVGIRGKYYEDSDERENWRIEAFAGVDPIPQLVVEGYIGKGELKQDATTNNIVVDDRGSGSSSERYRVDEVSKGVKGSYRIVSRKGRFNPIALGVDVGQRDYSGDATHSINTLAAQASVRPWLPLTLLGRFEHDSIENAQAVVEKTDYDMWGIDADYRIRDWWDLIATFRDYDISDGNTRDHLRLQTMWELLESLGLWAGLRYDRVDADFYRDAYWTPKRLRQYAVVLQMKQRYFDFYYDLWVLFGRAKEDVSDEEEERYRKRVVEAEIGKWPDGPGDAPETDWKWVYTASGLVQYEMTKHLRAFVQAAYIKVPEHREFHLKGGLKCSF